MPPLAPSPGVSLGPPPSPVKGVVRAPWTFLQRRPLFLLGLENLYKRNPEQRASCHSPSSPGECSRKRRSLIGQEATHVESMRDMNSLRSGRGLARLRWPFSDQVSDWPMGGPW